MTVVFVLFMQKIFTAYPSCTTSNYLLLTKRTSSNFILFIMYVNYVKYPYLLEFTNEMTNLCAILGNLPRSYHVHGVMMIHRCHVTILQSTIYLIESVSIKY